MHNRGCTVEGSVRKILDAFGVPCDAESSEDDEDSVGEVALGLLKDISSDYPHMSRKQVERTQRSLNRVVSANGEVHNRPWELCTMAHQISNFNDHVLKTKMGPGGTER